MFFINLWNLTTNYDQNQCNSQTINTSNSKLFDKARYFNVYLFINVSNNLPKTSYIKMMDIWLIFNLLVPFTEICLHTYMDMLRSVYYPLIHILKYTLYCTGARRGGRSTTTVKLSLLGMRSLPTRQTK